MQHVLCDPHPQKRRCQLGTCDSASLIHACELASTGRRSLSPPLDLLPPSWLLAGHVVHGALACMHQYLKD